MLLDINRHDGSVDRAIGSDSQGCVFKPHQGHIFFLFFSFFLYIPKYMSDFEVISSSITLLFLKSGTYDPALAYIHRAYVGT